MIKGRPLVGRCPQNEVEVCARYAPTKKRYAPISGTESTAHLSQTGYGNYLVIGWVDIDAELLTPCKRNKK